MRTSDKKQANKKAAWSAVGLAVAAAVPVGALIAADSSPKALMHERHEHYEDLGKAFKKISDQAKSGSATADSSSE